MTLCQSVPAQLSAALSAAFASLGLPEDLGSVKIADRPDLADYQCNGAMAGAKQAGKNPRELAQAVLDTLTDAEVFGEFSIAGPGFINVKLNPDFITRQIGVLATDERCGVPAFSSDKIVIDFGGYNIAKALHIGHVRATLLGDGLQRLMRFAGDDVISDVHLGDWGTQMGMLIEAVKAEQPHLPYFDPAITEGYPEDSPITLEDLNRLYPAASALCKEDETAREAARLATADLQAERPGYIALWRHFVEASIAELKQDLAPFKVEFDYWLGESDVQPLIPSMVKNMQADGYAIESDGALIVPVAEELGREIIPLMLRKRDGAATYATTDLATILDRVNKFNPDSILYVVDARQQEHFQQVFAASHKTQITPKTLGFEHLWFGTINGKDGRPFKTRSGDTVKLKDVTQMVMDKARERLQASGRDEGLSPDELETIVAAVGMATIKFADLSNERKTNYILDLDAFSAAEGKTGPYLLYSAVRMKSILRQAQAAGLQAGPFSIACEQDRALALKLVQLPQIITLAHNKRELHHLCQYAFELAQAFSSFYAAHSILKENDKAVQAGWLTLCETTLAHLTLVLDLLGIDVPEKM